MKRFVGRCSKFETYQLTTDEWSKIRKLSVRARQTPVIALSTADGLAGRDLASMAREDVSDYWRELGRQYGFDPRNIQPVDESLRKIRARSTRDPDIGEFRSPV